MEKVSYGVQQSIIWVVAFIFVLILLIALYLGLKTESVRKFKKGKKVKENHLRKKQSQLNFQMGFLPEKKNIFNITWIYSKQSCKLFPTVYSCNMTSGRVTLSKAGSIPFSILISNKKKGPKKKKNLWRKIFKNKIWISSQILSWIIFRPER